MPNNWKTYKLEELTTKLGDGLHGTPKYSDNGEYYFINGNNLTNGKIEIKKDTKRVTYDEFLKHKKDLDENTLFVSINGTIGNVGTYNGEKVILGKSACYFNIKDGVDKEFIKQIFSSKITKDYLENNATGTTIKNVSLKTMREFPINLPPLQEQKSIASILSAIDDKIENNLAINKTLEEMAMALYKHWFVDFGPFQEGEFVESELGRIPEGWEVIQFSKIVSKYIDNRGKTPPIEEEGIPLLEVKHISSNLFPDLKVQKYVSENTYNNWFRNHLEEDDIIISTVGTVGLTSLVPTFSKVAIAQNLLGLRFEKNKFPTGFMFYLMKSPYFLNQIENRLVITVQKSIKRSDLDKIPCLIPNQNLINSFNEIATGYIKQIENNLTENQTLTQLRDTLLPKLISGEVRLKEFKESITN